VFAALQRSALLPGGFPLDFMPGDAGFDSREHPPAVGSKISFTVRCNKH
jgi:hypothetical protein